MAKDREYRTDDLGDDEASRLLRKILSPAEAQSLVRPPSDPAESFPAKAGTPDRSGDHRYIKVCSKGEVGYLPRENLQAALQIDANLKVLDEA
jgi:hypothetical protein